MLRKSYEIQKKYLDASACGVQIFFNSTCFIFLIIRLKISKRPESEADLFGLNQWFRYSRLSFEI